MPNQANKKTLFSINLNTASYADVMGNILSKAKSKRSSYMCLSNVHMLVEAYKDPSFAQVVNAADIAAPDGLPLTWGLKLVHGVKQERVAGMDFLPDLLTECTKEKLPVFFYGGTQTMLDKTSAHIEEHYAGLKVAGMLCPPFRVLTDSENDVVVDTINESGAKVVFVVLGCPKQEKWMASMKGKINAVMIGVGGALPVMVGMQKRAPKLIQKSGLEWAFRLAQDPKRLWKRYMVTNSTFLYLLATEKVRQRFRAKYPKDVISMHPSRRHSLKQTA